MLVIVVVGMHPMHHLESWVIRSALLPCQLVYSHVQDIHMINNPYVIVWSQIDAYLSVAHDYAQGETSGRIRGVKSDSATLFH
jgi:hypothetical protein